MYHDTVRPHVAMGSTPTLMTNQMLLITLHHAPIKVNQHHTIRLNSQLPQIISKMTTALARLRTVVAKRKLACVTAWDFPSGLLAETAGIDLVLVGDSLGITALGYHDTKKVTLDEMVHHTSAVARAFKSGFLLADLPFGSYEKSTKHGEPPSSDDEH